MTAPALTRNGFTLGAEQANRRLPPIQTGADDSEGNAPPLLRNGLGLVSAVTDRGLRFIECGPCEGLPDTFETLAANLDASDAVLSYSGGDLVSVVYANGVSKSLSYGVDGLASVALVSGGVTMVKTLTYTGGELTGVAYS